MTEESKNHYLFDLIDNECNDDEISILLESMLPKKCKVESDDLFLKVEYMSDSKLSNKLIFKMLKIPEECLVFQSTKKDKNDVMWEVLYITWEKIAGVII